MADLLNYFAKFAHFATFAYFANCLNVGREYMMSLSGSFYANWTTSTKMNREEMLLKNVPRLAPNEEETAAERCSEKLVDLVVLLTTKVVLHLVVVLLVTLLLLFCCCFCRWSFCCCRWCFVFVLRSSLISLYFSPLRLFFTLLLFCWWPFCCCY